MCREVMRKLFNIYLSGRTRQDMLLNLHSRAALQDLFISPYKLEQAYGRANSPVKGYMYNEIK